MILFDSTRYKQLLKVKAEESDREAALHDSYIKNKIVPLGVARDIEPLVEYGNLTVGAAADSVQKT